jgi:hypothetical protein
MRKMIGIASAAAVMAGTPTWSSAGDTVAARAFRERALSAVVCYVRERRARALADIQDERDASRIAGVVNKSRLYMLQHEVHEADKALNSRRAEMKKAGARELPCSAPGVDRLVACLRYDYDSVGTECPDTDNEWARLQRETLNRDL